MTSSLRIKSAWVLPAVIICGLLGGCGGGSESPDSASTSAVDAAAQLGGAEPTPIPSSDESFAYEGRDGATALDLLLEIDPDVTVKGSGEQAFVVGINGRVADEGKREFWALYVNGELATVGAGSLQTTSKDRIEWKLDTY